MDINWSEIKEEMKRDLGNIFQTNNPSYSDIDKGIELFQKVIYSKVGNFELGGLYRTLPAALNEAYTTKVGQLGPLRIIADSLEPYLKKIALIANLDISSIILTKQLVALFKLLQLNAPLTNQVYGQYPMLTEAELPNFKGQSEYLEYLCGAYLTRNKVHEAPDWNRKAVIENLTNLLVIFIYAAFKYQVNIEATPHMVPQTRISDKIGDDQKYLYYFISFGSTTNRIRNQVVSSFILNNLQEKGELELDEIQKSTNLFFSGEMNINYYQTLLQKLTLDGQLEYFKDQKKYKLSIEEKSRIVTVQKNFEENKKIFFLFLEDIANKYGIIQSITQLFDKLQDFIENNYNIDVAEAYDKGIEISKDENQAYQNFINFLQNLLPDKSLANNLCKDLIELSKDSDFLLRMCASKAFANLTNPDRFEQYIHQQERVVYLDTQIILFVLCLNYVPNASYNNIYYQTAEELIQLTQKNRNIKLKVSRLYLQEVAYQLKLALLLIPFEEIDKGKLSSNVFYQFYWHLKENNNLDQQDESFADFMNSWFRLLEEDAYDTRFHSIAYSNLYDFLTSSELNIEVETLPQYDNKPEAVEVLHKVLDSENFKYRPKNAIDNDSVMICHLTNADFHSIEPFFLTWDKVFTKFRKEFINKYKRNNTISFHLFNPARFLNHYSLLTLKINPKAITDDFISLMDSNNIHEKTQTIWDSVNKFLNIDNINSLKRKKYIAKIKELFEQELDYTIDDLSDVEKTQKVLQPFEEIMSTINDYFSYSSSYSLTQYRNLLLSEDYFDKVSKLIFASVASENNNQNVTIELEKLVKTFVEESKPSI
jgi:hypothetical protein